MQDTASNSWVMEGEGVSMAYSEELSYSRCEALLRAGVVGRVAVGAPEGPHILPINYSVVGAAIIMRTGADGLLARHGLGRLVAFEIDYSYHRGCSVVARGVTVAVEEPGEVAHIESVWAPRPWAGGDRPLLLKLPWSELSGRQLGSNWDPLRELPVRRAL